MNDFLFHLTFIFVFLGFTVIRALFHRKAQQSRGTVEYKEGRLHVGLRLIVGLPFIGAVFAYMIWPPILGWAQFPLAEWLRWLGVVLGLASLPLIWWVQWALDDNFSTVLHVRSEHALVTHGPYRWVRHPMYTVLYMNGLAALLLTANWLIGGVYLLSLTSIVVTRVRREEAAMLEKFGPAYRDYMARTGQFLPRLAD
jgi:protein-S-isoprenylcysteine O-methyltransferase Ste14